MNESTMRKLVVLAVVLLPALAFADAPPAAATDAAAPVAPVPALPAAPAAPASATATAAPAASRASPRWSFGGGLSYAIVSTSNVGTGVILGQVPAVTASLERRVSPRSWAVLGLSGAVSRSRQDIPEGDLGISRNDYRQLTIAAGLRRVVTRSTAPVEVSMVFLAQGGVFDAERRFESRIPLVTPAVGSEDTTRWFAGAQIGIALERELTEGIALRVASPLVGARYGRGSTRVPGQPDVGSNDFSAGVSLAPSLELRLLF
jgi:hypothetical protein